MHSNPDDTEKRARGRQLEESVHLRKKDVVGMRMLRCCAMIAQLDVHRRSGRSGKETIFETQPGAALRRLQDRCRGLGVAGVGWHAFRRGAAEDLIDEGSSVGSSSTRKDGEADSS